MPDPLIFHDLDGCLNLFCNDPQTFDERVHRRLHVEGWDVITDRRHVEWFAQLDARGVDVRWATSWELDALKFAAASGVGAAWGVLEFTRFNQHLDRQRVPRRDHVGRAWADRVASFKMPLIQAVAADRPCAIVDDDLCLDRQVKRWAQARSREGISTLLVCPYYEVGVTRAEFDVLMTWLDLLPSSGSSGSPEREAA